MQSHNNYIRSFYIPEFINLKLPLGCVETKWDMHICSIGMCTCTKQTLLSSKGILHLIPWVVLSVSEHVLLCNRSHKDISHVKHIKYTWDNFLLSLVHLCLIDSCADAISSLLFLKPFRTKILRARRQTYFKFFKVLWGMLP